MARLLPGHSSKDIIFDRKMRPMTIRGDANPDAPPSRKKKKGDKSLGLGTGKEGEQVSSSREVGNLGW